MLENKVHIIHITDLHIGEAYKATSLPTVEDILKDDRISSFIEFVKAYRNDNLNAVIHLVVTGDFIHQYGSDDPNSLFERVKVQAFGKFINDILVSGNIDKNNVVFCLGNHDKSRFLYRELLETKEIRTFNQVNALMPNRAKAKEYFKDNPRENLDNSVVNEILEYEGAIFINPYALVEGCNQPTLGGKDCFYNGVKSIGAIDYVVFNSSWLCGESYKECGIDSCNMSACKNKPCANIKNISFGDDGFISMGETITNKVLADAESLAHRPRFKVGLIHHHVNSLYYTNYLPVDGNESIWSRAIKQCPLILIGHEHGEVDPYLGELSSYVFRSGSLLSKEDLKGYNSFNILIIDFETETIKRNTFIYRGIKWDINFRLSSNEFQFPHRVRKVMLNHNIQVNDYYDIQRDRFLNRVEVYDANNPVVHAHSFLEEDFDIEVYAKFKKVIIYDFASIEESLTLTEYQLKHAFVRAHVLKKFRRLKRKNFVWIESFKILDYVEQL